MAVGDGPSGGLRRATPLATIALTGLLLAAIAALAGLMIWQNYHAAVATAEARAKASAHLVAAHIEWMLEASDQALRRIDVALGEEPIRSSPDTIANISDAVSGLPEGFQHSVYDRDGHLRLSSVPEAIGITVADRDYFQELRDGAQVVVSPRLEERLSGQQVFVIARRISRGGVFHGAASIAIPTATIATFWASMELGPHSTVSVLREDGWLVARYPELPATLDLSAAPLFTTYLPDSSSGAYHSAASLADGLPRIVGYWRVHGWPLIATASIERHEALKFFWSSLRSGLALGVPAMTLLVIGLIWIARLLRADADRRAKLEKALERNRFLFREIHHRVKNNLQTVSSLVGLQPLPQPVREDMARRIAAMVAVHEHIYRSDQFDSVEVAPYIERLVRDIAAGYDRGAEIETILDPLTVDRDQALPLALIVNEAVSNAFKHAFSAGEPGTLRVALSQKADGDGLLVISDNGPGYTPGRNDKGMGSRLIAGFTAQLGGTFTIEGENGTVLSVSFPLDRARMPI